MNRTRRAYRRSLRAANACIAVLLPLIVSCGDSTTEPVPDGTLVVTIEGLPEGTSAAVTVLGPGNFSRLVSTTTTLSDLKPGSYSIKASAVVSGLSRYEPLSATVTTTVNSNATAQTRVAYTIVSASLVFSAVGLPAGTLATIQLQGPGGTLTARSDQVLNLAPGTYTINATNVRTTVAPIHRYQPNAPPQTIDVPSAQTAPLSITYQQITGSVQVTLSGLPAGGTNPVVKLKGPENAAGTTVSPGTLITDLLPGSYTLTTDRSVIAGATYVANAVDITVTAGQSTPAAVSIGRVQPSIVTYATAVNATVVLTSVGATATNVSAVVRDSSNTIIINPVASVSRAPAIARAETDGSITPLSPGQSWIVTTAEGVRAPRDSVLIIVTAENGVFVGGDLSRYQLDKGTVVMLNLVIDLSKRPTAERIGAAKLRVTWSPQFFTYENNSEVTPGVAAVVNDAQAANGVLQVAFANGAGFSGRTLVRAIQLRVTQTATAGQLAVQVEELVTTNFDSLIPHVTAATYGLRSN